MPVYALANSDSFTEAILRKSTKIHQTLEKSSFNHREYSIPSSEPALMQA